MRHSRVSLAQTRCCQRTHCPAQFESQSKPVGATQRFQNRKLNRGCLVGSVRFHARSLNQISLRQQLVCSVVYTSDCYRKRTLLMAAIALVLATTVRAKPDPHASPSPARRSCSNRRKNSGTTSAEALAPMAASCTTWTGRDFVSLRFDFSGAVRQREKARAILGNRWRAISRRRDDPHQLDPDVGLRSGARMASWMCAPLCQYRLGH